MAADVTKVFLSTVKALQSTVEQQPHPTPPRIPSLKNGIFKEQCTRTLRGIFLLRDYLSRAIEECGSASSLGNAREQIVRRAELTAEAERMTEVLRVSLRGLRSEVGRESGQVREHQAAVCDRLQTLLQAVTVQYATECESPSWSWSVFGQNRGREPLQSISPLKVTAAPASNDGNKQEEMDGPRQRRRPKQPGPQELLSLQLENDALHEELVSTGLAAQRLHSTLSEISALQGTFGDNLLSQSATVDHIGSLACCASDNVVQANEQMKEAMQSQSSVRFWILFVVVVCTLSLIFLDWYNE